jgi:hypothetical protein
VALDPSLATSSDRLDALQIAAEPHRALATRIGHHIAEGDDMATGNCVTRALVLISAALAVTGSAQSSRAESEVFRRHSRWPRWPSLF